ncbi:hypothetical protein KVV02_003104 [Mortierella alpina]|uniref:Uncharacterized protein n=1 Tax=Mortierella alpina TaxID=64518 RepID=A0A9P8A0M3_MORAP|nr:hypothetical protein KVV02_003104 [Mortierella alpina]
MSGRHHHEPSRHNLEVSNHPNYHANAHAHSAPHRPHRSKRAIPDPAGAPALGSSLSQLSLQDDLAGSLHSSLPSSPSTVSLASSLVDIRQLDSGVDLQEAPKPVNRRSNRGFRIIQPTEMDEFNLQESIRHSKAAQKPLPPQPTTVLNQDQDDKDDDKDDDDDEESYFGDILDKYCDSDEDPASPTSPASKLPSWKDLHTAQPPTPPVSRSLNAQQTNTASRRAPTASSAPSPTPTARRDNHSSSSSDGPLRREPGSDRTGTRSRENSVSSSPMNPASAKFNMYLHAGAAQESRDSLAKSSSTASSSSASSTARAYTKRPPPPPKDQAPNSLYVSTAHPSAPAFQPRTSSSSGSSVVSPSHPSGSDNINRNHISGHYRGNEPSYNAKEPRPDPPPKDTSRRPHHSHTMSTHSSSSNGRTSSSSQPPVLSLDTQTSDSFGSFADVVDATINRHRASPSVSSTASGHSYNQDSHVHTQGSSRARSNSNQHQPAMRSSDRYEPTAHGHRSESGQGRSQGQGHTSEQSRHAPSHRHQEHREHHHQHHHSHSSQGHHSSQSQSHSRSHSHSSHSESQNQSPQQYHQPYKTSQSTSYRMHGSTSQLDLTGSGYSTKTSPTPLAPARGSSQQQQPPLLGERSRSYSHGAVSAATSSSTQHGYPSSSRGLKSTLVKTPIARARAKEAHGPRKVLFGDMITIVSIERAETPPPPPVLDKKARKKLLQAKKNAAGKEGKGGGPIQNFDPEYDAAYYNTPFTPTPAEVVVTLAPWIGNPNYDEEKANSKFYYDDEYDYDDEDEYDYDTAHASDIRLGPEDDDEDDEDEDDEDDEEYASRSWGHGIAGPGGSLPKKKGGMFKFKRAVNKLFLN